MHRIAVIGAGYWGPNFVRIFSQLPNSEVAYVCDKRAERLAQMKLLYPLVNTTSRLEDVLEDDGVDGVVVATPVATHHNVAKQVLEAGKHVLVEKPLCLSTNDADDLIATSKKSGTVLMVGHTFLFTAAVNKVKDLLRDGELGDIHYIASNRLNLGIFQEDMNVIWDLAPHDISILHYVLERDPIEVSAHGQSFIRKPIEDVAFVTLRFPGDVVAHLHVSWLDPCKIRRTTFVGSKKMVVYDDIETLEKIRIYDKGVDVQPHYDTFGEFHLAYRFGDIFTPKLVDQEPLKAEAKHFLDGIDQGKVTRGTAAEGRLVVRVLEAASESLEKNGAFIPLA
ncbi:MAG: Gfo/Idh/MocA family oxidoreductase [Candidatus Eisenbacteria bacterium]|nr:Gfo/Idh/MocA family oxidoreductase [Candidatus Eisenbacteria bacterium]